MCGCVCNCMHHLGPEETALIISFFFFFFFVDNIQFKMQVAPGEIIQGYQDQIDVGTSLSPCMVRYSMFV